ncbi:hypothetical protein EV421DRAFT_1845487 [Armillaria borealis]|uniref:Uncharacterized protein n=1 Tax=Armillaria borealis TaxID=47425 RepID=A0AA39J1Z6_9AGAR|nr:hypothetical protein EV421DRAFT_1845487 [Armillaria borealis]
MKLIVHLLLIRLLLHQAFLLSHSRVPFPFLCLRANCVPVDCCSVFVFPFVPMFLHLDPAFVLIALAGLSHSFSRTRAPRASHMGPCVCVMSYTSMVMLISFPLQDQQRIWLISPIPFVTLDDFVSPSAKISPPDTILFGIFVLMYWGHSSHFATEFLVYPALGIERSQAQAS